MSYACVRTDNMSGTVEGKNLVSLRYDGDIENGSIVSIGAFVSGEREVRIATAPSADASLRDLALVATPEVIKNKNYYGLSDFINERGTLIRGYRLTPRDVFSVTRQAFGNAENLTVGAAVELDGGSTKFVAKASPTGSATVIGKIVAIEEEWYVIEVVVMSASAHKPEPEIKDFSAIQKAFTGAGDGETTIKLGGTISMAGQLVLDNPRAVVTLDLNGNQMNGNVLDESLIRVKQGKLIVKGNGTMKNEGNYVFKVGYSTDDNVSEPASSGELVIEDGTFVGNCTAVQVTGGTATIEGGDYSIVEDSAHDYKYLLNCIDRFYKNGKAKIEVTGGTFHKFNPKDCGAEGSNTNFVKTGFTVDEDVDKYTVRSE